MESMPLFSSPIDARIIDLFIKAQRRRTVKGILYVSGDGLRIVDVENNRGLLLDQTIEKVATHFLFVIFFG